MHDLIRTRRHHRSRDENGLGALAPALARRKALANRSIGVTSRRRLIVNLYDQRAHFNLFRFL